MGKAVLPDISKEGPAAHPHPPPVLTADTASHSYDSSWRPSPGSRRIAIPWIRAGTMVETYTPHGLRSESFSCLEEGTSEGRTQTTGQSHRRFKSKRAV